MIFCLRYQSGTGRFISPQGQLANILTVADAHLQPGHRRVPPPARAWRLARLLPQACAPVRCHVSKGQEAGRTGCLKMLIFGSRDFRRTAGPGMAPHMFPVRSARLLPVGWRTCPLPCERRVRRPGGPDTWRGWFSGSRDFRIAAGPG